MTAPAYSRTWHQANTGGVPGVRIPFVSVTDAAQNAFYQTKADLCGALGQTTPMTVLWSASGGVGPTNAADHTDRITSSATVTPQATVAAASQAWCVLVGAPRPSWQVNTLYTQGQYVTNGGNVYVCRGNVNGTGLTGTSAASGGPTTTAANITDNTAAWQFLQAGTGAPQVLFAYQGASADIFRISVSPGGLFTLAATTNNQPTATDELVFCSATSIVGNTASGDRILHVWASDDGNAWKMLVCRAGAMVSPLLGTETIQEGVTQFPVNGSASVATLPCPIWAFCYSAANLASGQVTTGYTANAKGGLVRTLVSGVGYSGQVVVGVESIAPGGVLQSPEVQYTYQAELQGASGYPPYPLAVHTTNTVGSRGRLGNLIDWYVANPSGVAAFAGYGPSYNWIQCTVLLIPNPLAQQPTTT